MNEQIKVEDILNLNVNEFTEKKNGLTYLSWANAWKIALGYDAELEWSVDQYEGKPYLFDEHLGYMVSTKVTFGGKTLPMQLPVMDGANKAQKHVEYTYEVAEWVAGKRTGKMIEKKVLPASMFDINTAIMRCLVKNLALFGLGLYIYAGEDVPNADHTEEELPTSNRRI